MKSPTDFPYQSHFVEVLDAKIHYIDEGQGDPLLFLHGIPTSSYLWRKVIPYLTPYGRCIALDLVGMGKSDKPDIAYRVFDYIRYVDAFIKKMKLKRVTLVLHAWGSVIGFYYAAKHLKNIKGIAFLEAYLRPESKTEISLSMQQWNELLQSPKKAYDKIIHSNYFIDHILLSGMIGKLTPEELEHYRAPFKDERDRKLLWQYLQDLPIDDEPKDVVELIQTYSKKLMNSDIPKLMLYGIPGFQTTVDTIEWAKTHFKNLTLADIGEDLHYAQETNAENLGQALAKWYRSL